MKLAVLCWTNIKNRVHLKKPVRFKLLIQGREAGEMPVIKYLSRKHEDLSLTLRIQVTMSGVVGHVLVLGR